MKKNQLGSGIFLAILSCFIIYIMISEIKSRRSIWDDIKQFNTFRFNYSKTDSTKSTSYDESNSFTFDDYRISEIKCDMISEDIMITENSDSEIHIYFKGNWQGSNPKAYISENILQISRDNMIILNAHRIVEISIPSSWKKTITISCVSSNVSLNKNEIENLYINSVSGDQIITSNSINSINCNTISGDIKLQKIKANEIQTKTTSGDINFYNIESNKIDSSSTSGDIFGNIATKAFNFVTSSGDISISLIKEIEDQSFISTTSGDIKLENEIDIAYKYSTNTKSGSARILNNSNNISNVSVNLRTTSGDITVR